MNFKIVEFSSHFIVEIFKIKSKKPVEIKSFPTKKLAISWAEGRGLV